MNLICEVCELVNAEFVLYWLHDVPEELNVCKYKKSLKNLLTNALYIHEQNAFRSFMIADNLNITIKDEREQWKFTSPNAR